MKPIARLLPLVGLCLGLATAPASAQSGFALKGHYVYNSSAADGLDADRIPSADGIGVGLEYVLPIGLGVGVSGYSAGRKLDGGIESREFTMLAEANYFLNLPLLPLTPYAGVHAGLGQYSWEDLDGAGQDPRLEDRTRSQLGYQFGLRFQPTGLIGFDAQYRRVSNWALENQGEQLERSQILLGVTLF